MKGFLAGIAVVAVLGAATYAALLTFDQSTAELYADRSVVLLDHATSWLEDGHAEDDHEE